MRRSRSPVRYIRRSREKSFSMSSLSDCSLGRSPKKFSSGYTASLRRGKSYRDDKFHGKQRDKDFVRGKKISRSRSRERDRRPVRIDTSRSNHLTKPSTSYKGIGDMREKLRESSRDSKHKKQTANPGDRLQRLEHMVELLVTNKSAPKQEKSPETKTFEFNPRNTVFTTSMWLNRINDQCMDRNFGEKDCIKYIQSKMTGLIKSWFKTLDLFDYTWPEIKMLIINTFPDNVNFASTLRLLVNRLKKSEETITQYYFSKMYLLEACKITGANAVSVLIDGLNDPFWQQEAKNHNYQNPEVFYTEFLSKLPNYGLQQTQEEGYAQAMVEQTIAASQPQYQFVEYPKKTYNRHGEVVEDLRNNLGSSRLEKVKVGSSKDANKKCFKCASFGHVAANCPDSGAKCFLCLKTGHVAARCPKDNHRSPY